MKRYMLFWGEIYYATGGFHDFKNSFDDLESAIAIAKKAAKDYTCDWWHIVDLEQSAIVAKSDNQAHGA